MTTTSQFSTIPLTLALAFALPACTLLGVESEDLDVVETGDEEMSTMGSGEGETSGSSDSNTGTDSDAGSEGTDTDSGTDTDTDPSTGDGDGDPPGDGDGDPAGDGDGDATGGDGDGDATGGDDTSCEELLAGELMPGDNPISVAMGPSLINGMCGSDGPESVYSFTATSDGTHEFTLLPSDEFQGALYLTEGGCVPLGPSECELEGMALQVELTTNQVVYLIVDADVAGNGIIDVLPP